MTKSSDLQTIYKNKLAESGLTDGDARTMKLKLYTVDQLKQAVRDWAGWTGNLWSGFRIPYFDVNGKATGFWRYRYLDPKGFAALVQKKFRYTQPLAKPQVYFPPLHNWAQREKLSYIVVTEGELKAASGCHFRIPTVGLGGAWVFKSKDTLILPALEEVIVPDLALYIAYDSDAASNPEVMAAENALARRALKLGAVPYIIRIPDLSSEGKTGLDDFLVHRDGGPKAFEELRKRAKQWATSEALHRMNEEVVYVRDPSHVIEYSTLQRMTGDKFKQEVYVTRTHAVLETKGKETKAKEVSTAKEWFQWPYRAEVQRTTYLPGGELIVAGEHGRELNLWRGWGVESRKGDIAPWNELLKFLFKGASTEARLWFEQWLAYPVQHPGTKLATAVLLWSEKQGVGKTTISDTMVGIYGRANCVTIGNKDLESSHNDWFENKQFCNVEEILVGDGAEVSIHHRPSAGACRPSRRSPSYTHKALAKTRTIHSTAGVDT